MGVFQRGISGRHTSVATGFSQRFGVGKVRREAFLATLQSLRPGEKPFLICRDDWIRTSGLFVPNEARYRAALHPEKYVAVTERSGKIFRQIRNGKVSHRWSFRKNG